MHCVVQLPFLCLVVCLAYSPFPAPNDPWDVLTSEASCSQGHSSSLLQRVAGFQDDAPLHTPHFAHEISEKARKRPGGPGQGLEGPEKARRALKRLGEGPEGRDIKASVESHTSTNTMFPFAARAILNQFHAARMESHSVYQVGALCSLLFAIIAMAWFCFARRSKAVKAPSKAALFKSEGRPFSQEGMCVHDADGKLYTYDNGKLVEWGLICATRGSVFCHRRVVHVIIQVLALSLATAAVQFYFAAHLPDFDPSKFQTFIKFIRVFIAFLLGLFLNASFGRWWTSVTCFKKLLTSIKQLMFTLHTIGIRDEERKKVERLGIAACFIVCEDMHCASALIVGKCCMDRWEQKLKWLEEKGHLTADERQELEANGPMNGEVGLHSQVLWSWIGEVITRIKPDPKMTPPLYVKLVFLCHTCLGIFDELKTSLMIQVPYSYCHMLAVLVHVTNIVLAVIFGLEVGSMLAAMQLRGKGGWNLEGLEAAALQLFILVAQPMLYQSVLVICEANLQPYGDELCHMPTGSFIQQMLHELQTMEESFANARRRAVEESSGDLQGNPWYKRERNDDYVDSDREEEEEDDGAEDCDDGGGD